MSVPPDPALAAPVTIAGPVNRESFLAEQARNRRATWRIASLCIGAILLMGIPVSVVVTPLLYATGIIAYDVVRVFVPLPDFVQYLHDLDAKQSREASANQTNDSDEISLRDVAIIAAILVPPGMLTLVLLWAAMQRLFMRSGAGAVLLSLGARLPRTGDLEEQQLTNLAQEMAIAAGVPAPRVMLLDVPVPCAAAVGSSTEDSTILVSRQLLDTFDRDETTAVVGHLIGSVGNGDLRISMRMLSVYQAVGMMITILQMPFGPKSRGLVWQVFRMLVGLTPIKGDHHDSRQVLEREAIAGMLTSTVSIDHSGDIDTYTSTNNTKTGWRDVVRLPFLIAYLAVWMTQIFAIGGVIRPLMAHTWRTRRLLADATAVQLTRQADPLVRALRRLTYPRGESCELPGAAWAMPLFIAPFTTQGKDVSKWNAFLPDFAQRLERLLTMGASPDAAGDFPMPKGFWQRLSGDLDKWRTAGHLPMMILFCVVVGLGAPLGIFLILGIIITLTGIAIAIDGLFLMPMVLLLHFLLSWIGSLIH